MSSGPEGLINGLTEDIKGCPQGDPFCFGGGCSSHAREGVPQSGPIDPVRVRRKELGIPEYDEAEAKYHTFSSRVFSLPRLIDQSDGAVEVEVGENL